MKTIYNSLVLLVLAWFLAATSAAAVTFTNLYIFSADAFPGGPNAAATNSDGVNPNGFVLSGNTFYGTAAAGGRYGSGTIFRVDTDGEHFTNLFDFNNGPYDSANSTYPESTGDMPNPGLLLLSNTLYGTTFYGGTDFAGTVFKMNTDGSGFAVLHSFDYTDGAGPADGLTLYSNALYGTTAGGGSDEDGTIFKINLSDLSFASVYNFTNLIDPYGGLVVYSNTFYGFGYYGGANNQGLIYGFRPEGAVYFDLFDFDGTNGWASHATPTLSGNTLYGVTYQGGTNGGGNVFRINIDGLQYTNLYNFQRQSGANTTGANPYDFSGLVLSDNILYGTTSVSGSGGQGTVFALNTDGSGFTVLHSFQYTDGGNPEPLILSGGTLYGMTLSGIQGVGGGDGALFALVLQPTLNIALADDDVVLTWNDPSYFLYASPSLTNVFTKITGISSPYTNTVTGVQQFFQLRAN
jgi:uncharacterized repeat protein (TIGR03803 family)